MSINISIDGNLTKGEPVMRKQVFGNTVVLGRNDTDQSITGGVETTIQYDTIIYHGHNYFDLDIDNTVKIKHDGLYTLVGTLKLDTSTQNTIYTLNVYVNGSLVRSRRIVDIDANPLDWGLADVLELKTGDELQLKLLSSADCSILIDSVFQMLLVA